MPSRRRQFDQFTEDDFYTIDLDSNNEKYVMGKYTEICTDPNTKSATLSKSARKGYHIRVHTFDPVLVFRTRYRHGDDPKRLLHDLYDKPPWFTDTLWDQKIVKGVEYNKKLIDRFERS